MKDHDRPMRYILRLAFTIAVFLVGPVEALDYKLFIMAGQSNMVGSAHVLNPTFPQDQQTFFEDVLYTQNTDNGSEGWGPLQPRLSQNGTFRDRVGPELTFGETVLNADIGEIAVIKYARNGTGLATNWAPGGALRNDFYNFVDNATQELVDQGHTYELSGFIWVQGSGDANFLSRASAYDENLTQFVSEIEDRYNKTTTVINRYHIDADRNYVEELRSSQRAFGDAHADAYVVHGDDLTLFSDYVHYDFPSQLELGRRLAERYLQTLEQAGDYNRDGRVDIADYTVWRDSLGSLSALESDGDGDGVVDIDDLPYVAKLCNWSIGRWLCRHAGAQCVSHMACCGCFAGIDLPA